MRLIRTLYILICLCLAPHLMAQGNYQAEVPSRTTLDAFGDRLSLRLLAEAFFRNNEYASDLIADYTLPGYRFRADLGFRPNTSFPVELRLGVSNLYYWGASRYPSAIAYLDLPYWSGEGERYTKFRLRPFFQASILPTKGLAILLGGLEGGAKHELIEPLYNPELNLTADEETGLQIKYVGERTKIDTWVDWRSFIFRGEAHPEAFIFGLTARHRFPLSSVSSLGLELQALAHHRGGVLNKQADTVHTWLNTALGISYEHQFKVMEAPLSWRTSAFALSYTQRGEHYSVNEGWGIYAESEARWRRWQAKMGLWYGTDFIGVLGVPFAQSVGRKGRQVIHSHHPRYLSLSASYRIMESMKYSLSLSAGVWVHPHSADRMSSYIEAYLSISPYFGLLK